MIGELFGGKHEFKSKRDEMEPISVDSREYPHLGDREEVKESQDRKKRLH